MVERRPADNTWLLDNLGVEARAAEAAAGQQAQSQQQGEVPEAQAQPAEAPAASSFKDRFDRLAGMIHGGGSVPDPEREAALARAATPQGEAPAPAASAPAPEEGVASNNGQSPEPRGRLARWTDAASRRIIGDPSAAAASDPEWRAAMDRAGIEIAPSAPAQEAPAASPWADPAEDGPAGVPYAQMPPKLNQAQIHEPTVRSDGAYAEPAVASRPSTLRERLERAGVADGDDNENDKPSQESPKGQYHSAEPAAGSASESPRAQLGDVVSTPPRPANPFTDRPVASGAPRVIREEPRHPEPVEMTPSSAALGAEQPDHFISRFDSRHDATGESQNEEPQQPPELETLGVEEPDDVVDLENDESWDDLVKEARQEAADVRRQHSEAIQEQRREANRPEMEAAAQKKLEQRAAREQRAEDRENWKKDEAQLKEWYDEEAHERDLRVSAAMREQDPGLANELGRQELTGRVAELSEARKMRVAMYNDITPNDDPSREAGRAQAAQQLIQERINARGYGSVEVEEALAGAIGEHLSEERRQEIQRDAQVERNISDHLLGMSEDALRANAENIQDALEGYPHALDVLAQNPDQAKAEQQYHAVRKVLHERQQELALVARETERVQAMTPYELAKLSESESEEDRQEFAALQELLPDQVGSKMAAKGLADTLAVTDGKDILNIHMTPEEFTSLREHYPELANMAAKEMLTMLGSMSDEDLKEQMGPDDLRDLAEIVNASGSMFQALTLLSRGRKLDILPEWTDEEADKPWLEFPAGIPVPAEETPEDRAKRLELENEPWPSPDAADNSSQPTKETLEGSPDTDKPPEPGEIGEAPELTRLERAKQAARRALGKPIVAAAVVLSMFGAGVAAGGSALNSDSDRGPDNISISMSANAKSSGPEAVQAQASETRSPETGTQAQVPELSQKKTPEAEDTSDRITLNVASGKGIEDAIQEKYDLSDKDAADLTRALWPSIRKNLANGQAYQVGADIRVNQAGAFTLDGPNILSLVQQQLEIYQQQHAENEKTN